MPTLDQHQSNRSIKLLLLGDSGNGKTGALASLVAADYKLRIIDMDNGLDPLKTYAPQDKLKNVSFKTIRDKYKTTQMGPVVDGIPNAYVNALKALDDWGEDLGKPSTWGEDVIVVIDSLTLLSRAAYDWADALNPGAKDKRQVFYQAQQSILNAIAMLTSESFKPSVIVLAHVNYQEYQDGTTKGFPTSAGTAVGPKIPPFFNHIGLCEKTGSGANVQRTIRFSPTAVVDAKSPIQFAAPLPVATGLAEFFAKARK